MNPINYKVTLVNLAPDARTADPTLGSRAAVNLSAGELGSLLDAFCELDPLQNVSADPEIRVQHGSERYIARTGQKRLAVYNARDSTQPAQVLTTAELLAELDGSAAAARIAANHTANHTANNAANDAAAIPPNPLSPPTAGDTAAPVYSPKPVRRGKAIPLLALTFLMIGAAVWAQIERRPARPSDDVVPLPVAERAGVGRTVEGVYVTGVKPGDRGIVVNPAGMIRFFQLNAAAAPTVVRDTWQAGRRGAVLCLAMDDLGTVVEIVDRNNLVYGGERYRRAAAP